MQEKATISQPPKTTSTKGSKKFTILLLIAIVVVGVLFYRADRDRREAERKLQETTQKLEEIKKSSENSGAAAAKRILERVRMLINVPTDPEPTVATITDIEALRKTNDFYKKGENNDNLIITKERAILYDPDRNIILDVVPIIINQDEQAKSASPSPKPSPSPSSSPAA